MFNKMTKRDRTKIKNCFGVIPIPIYTNCFNCKLSCVYCPKQKNIPKSYISNKDTLLAQKLEYSPRKQINYWINRIRDKFPNGIPYKLEIIILGGTFGDLSKKYRKSFFKGMLDTLNECESKNLKESILKNADAKHRACVITVETRPDNITNEECIFLLTLGVSKVELGVQTIYNDVLKFLGRPYNFEKIVKARNLLLKYGFKIGFHIMINLPLSDQQMDKKLLKEICCDPYLIPDFLKIYPLTLIKDETIQPKMWELYEKKIWVPYSREDILSILSSFLSEVPEFIRIQRFQRQFNDLDFFYSKFKFRKKLENILRKRDIEVKCIRSQEIKTYNSGVSYTNQSLINLSTQNYDGYNYFITIKNKNNLLLGYLRLYLNQRSIIREVKVIGESSPVGKTSKIQGRGLGKLFIKSAEKFSKKKGYKEVFVNTSPGVRDYFKKLGFIESNYLMKKELK